MIGRLLESRASIPVSGVHPSDEGFTEKMILTGTDTHRPSKITTPDSMLTIDSVWCATNLVANSLKALPLRMYGRLEEGGRVYAKGRPENRLYRKPNPGMSISRFIRLQAMWLCTRGNGYAEIVKNGFGEPVGLYPVHPAKVEVWRNNEGQHWYVVRGSNGDPVVLDPSSMLHFQWVSLDGYIGVPPLGLWRQSLGHIVTVQEYGARFFANDCRMPLLVTHPEQLTPEQKDEWRREWRRAYENGGGPAVVDAGIDIKTMSFNNSDSQFLDLRKYEEGVGIARRFFVPPYKIKDEAKLTYNNAEQLAIEYVTDAIMPHAIDIEQEFDLKLLTGNDAETYYTEMELAGLLRADTETTYKVYELAVNCGVLNRDEAREMMNRNPIPDGLGQIFTGSTNTKALAVMQKEIDAPMQAPAPALRQMTTLALSRAIRRERKRLKAATDKGTLPQLADEISAELRESLTPVARYHRPDDYTGRMDRFVERYKALAIDHAETPEARSDRVAMIFDEVLQP